MQERIPGSSLPGGDPNVVAEYQRQGYACNDITGRSALVEKRIGIQSLADTDRVFLCSKKEPGLFTAQRLSVVLIIGVDGALKHVGGYTDSIHM